MDDSPDIQVTPEMIEAGAEILSFCDPEWDSTRQTALEVFRAMLQARNEPTERMQTQEAH